MRTLIVAICACTLIAGIGSAYAQDKKPKISREQAWSICAQAVASVDPEDHSQRYSRAAACMKKFGYNI